MISRRKAVSSLLGAVAVIPVAGLMGCTEPAKPFSAAASSPNGRRVVRPAHFERPAQPGTPVPYRPFSVYQTEPAEAGYLEEEWFISGVDDSGQSYKTQVVAWMPQDRSRFSGTVIVEPLHAQGVPPILMYVSPYVVRSGHGWAWVASQKMPLDEHIKASDPGYYGSLHVGAPPGAPPLQRPAAEKADPAAAAEFEAQMNQMRHVSDTILAQAGAAFRSDAGPFANYDVEYVILVGHSQTGGVVTHYILNEHDAVGLPGGAPVYDGFFPTGAPRTAFGPRDVPLVQLISEGDVADAEWRAPEHSGRRYRRSDSDDPTDRYRLYELAGTAHMGTRYPPHNDPDHWKDILGETGGVIMNSMPHHEQFSMGLHHLVEWVGKGLMPPRAPRLQLATGGRYFAKDEHGNTLGGIRSSQIDVPRATYYPNPVNPDGTPRRGVVGMEVPFDNARMRALYGTPANYAERFNRRLAELIRQGWILAEDAPNLRAEAAAQRF